ncbi:MAG: hypothetical protein KDK66_02045, partial [Deltaproteobacteria bacterium]|nr:hypothetical protein [Deltaproteobacteria bacterium]
MKKVLRIRNLLILLYLILAAVVWLALSRVQTEIRPLYLESVEEILVDEANLIASFLEKEIQNKQFKEDQLAQVFQNLSQRQLNAKIYGKTKSKIDTSL